MMQVHDEEVQLDEHDTKQVKLREYETRLVNMRRNIALIESGEKKPKNLQRRFINLRLEERLLLEKISVLKKTFA